VFISFEGGEGAGKTTLIDRLYDKLTQSGKKVIKTIAPGGTGAGALIRQILLDKKEVPLCYRSELLLFLADRAQHVEEVIIPALKSETVVLCDRFNDSTIAYQGVRGFDTPWLRTLCSFATNNLHPDLTFYLDIDPQKGLHRVKHRTQDRIEEEALSFHEKIRTAYLHIAQEEPTRFHILPADRTPEDVFLSALKILNAYGLTGKEVV
jgi:dTMP kinase